MQQICSARRGWPANAPSTPGQQKVRWTPTYQLEVRNENETICISSMLIMFSSQPKTLMKVKRLQLTCGRPREPPRKSGRDYFLRWSNRTTCCCTCLRLAPGRQCRLSPRHAGQICAHLLSFKPLNDCGHSHRNGQSAVLYAYCRDVRKLITQFMFRNDDITVLKLMQMCCAQPKLATTTLLRSSALLKSCLFCI